MFGLLVDSHGPGLEILSSLCRSNAGPDLLLTLRLHWMWLPAMHVGMIMLPLGWSARHCRAAPLLRQMGCSVWMMVGMTGGAMVPGLLPNWPAGPAVMLVTMCVGMAGGMLLGRAVRQLMMLSRFFRSKPELVHG
jgi:hypothetical protein